MAVPNIGLAQVSTAIPMGDSCSAAVGDPMHEMLNKAETVTQGQPSPRFGRTICADVAALDQILVYNRFGSFNPFGMIFALTRDLVSIEEGPKHITADACDDQLGSEAGGGILDPGKVRLKDCKRPRPMVLRANVGDVLHLRLTNLLLPNEKKDPSDKLQPYEKRPGFSSDFCGSGDMVQPGVRGDAFPRIRKWVAEGDETELDHGEATCRQVGASSPGGDEQGDNNWPGERGLNFAIQGLKGFDIDDRGEIVEAPRACKGLANIAPGETVDCYYMIEREGPFFMASTAAPSGGQGDGGSITHGLFGAVVAENTQSRWYRSQTSHGAFKKVWPQTNAPRHALGSLSSMKAYEKLDDHGVPILNMLRDLGRNRFELVHSDLNAIVHQPKTQTEDAKSFREFSVFFHDELKTFVTRNFEELEDFAGGQLAGVRDGFAINYGAGGMGAMLLANRKGIGPAANCVECLYEEFFLTSWANGDPALLEQYSDDPSNVHHSYLNDAVVFRNFHAGPKETHVFHLHAHQWFAGNDEGRGSYLDSQTVGPQQGFSYNIYDGGLEVYRAPPMPGEKGWYETLGSGNRNRTPGDSIFHCHLYPHFAQGMWELWRVHDVLEDGTRKLPDGQWQPDFSLAEMDLTTRAKKRPGSVHPATGRWIDMKDQEDRDQIGTPVPALIPLPDQPWPLLPSYEGQDLTLNEDGSLTQPDGSPVGTKPQKMTSFPGYPYYIGGKPGHRPPQPPMDIARDLDRNNPDLVTDSYLDGGLPRHVVTDNASRAFPFEVPALDPLENVASLDQAFNNALQRDREKLQAQIVAKALALGDLTMKFKTALVDLLPYDGTTIEQTGMAFHAKGKLTSGAELTLFDALGNPTGISPDGRNYRSVSASGGGGVFAVNGAPAKPGAPFADPCGGFNNIAAGDVPQEEKDPLILGLPKNEFQPDPGVSGYRRYQGSAVQLDLVTNRAGWHDPQARINVLTKNSDRYKDGNAYASDEFGVGKYAPKVSAEEQPFFFRALSGECIEFRHTNELPKDLELDDFQVRTPTDTVGQHIHLVKFDVTASDGSGNGFNYEDGTLAADEIASRICAAKNKQPGDIVPPNQRAPGELKMREVRGLCVQEIQPDRTTLWVVSKKFKDIWRRQMGATVANQDWQNRDLFQTTTQRWFADPILSSTRAKGQNGEDYDRTMRTVFSHDHFGPSSIQQHGFYTALVIEPPAAEICDEEIGACTPQRSNTDRSLRVASDIDVGERKIIRDLMPLEEGTAEFREFALSIADFALLYDPRDTVTADEVMKSFDPSQGVSEHAKGMGKLVCEGLNAVNGTPETMDLICDSDLTEEGSDWASTRDDVPPAWVAAGRPGDSAHPMTGILLAEEVEVSPALNDANASHDDLSLADHMIRYRRMAAGFDASDAKARLAKPINPPFRPESISVDHHDPYLVNYRGEPLPLRIGTDSSASSDCELKPLSHWVWGLQNGVAERCEISVQRNSPRGDLANAFLTGMTGKDFPVMHGDPATPILRAHDNDPVQIRLIQGAQEVQHTFTLEGYTFPRNIDQSFPSVLPRMDDVSRRGLLVDACREHPVLSTSVRLAIDGRPDQYQKWMIGGPTAFNGVDEEFWEDLEKQMAQCFNVEGRIAAQEIGISEHFEFRATYLYNSNFEGGNDSAQIWERVNFYLQTAEAPPELLPFIFELDAQRKQLKALQRRAMPADTLFHFGSTDALWNGAWGLLRVTSPVGLNLTFDLSAELTLQIDRTDAAIDQMLGRDIGVAEAQPLRDSLLQNGQSLLELRPTENLVLAPEIEPITPETPIPNIEELLNERLRGLELPEFDPDGLLILPELSPGNLSPARPAPIQRGDAVGPAQRPQLPLRANNLTAPVGPADPVDPVDPVAPTLTPERVMPIQFDGPPVPLERLRVPRSPFPNLLNREDRDRLGVIEPDLVAKCVSTAPRVYATIVAIEASTVFDQDGTPYSGVLHDPDGLFFAIIDPRPMLSRVLDRRIEQITGSVLYDSASWKAIPMDAVIQAVRQAYDRPEPMVLNVNAGDCVRVTWINALRETDRRGWLKDRPGDALMPKITSLNVDRRWSPEESPDDDPDENNLIVTEVVPGSERYDARPSSRLAINFPLPVMNKQTSYARPTGRNPIWALDGAPSGPTNAITLSNDDRPSPEYHERLAQIMQIEFYAGRAFGSRDALPIQVAINPSTVALLPQLRQYIPAALESVTFGDILADNPLMAEAYRQALNLSDGRAPLNQLGQRSLLPPLPNPETSIGSDLDQLGRLADQMASVHERFAAIYAERLPGARLADPLSQEQLVLLPGGDRRLSDAQRQELQLEGNSPLGQSVFRGTLFGENLILDIDLARKLGLLSPDQPLTDKEIRFPMEAVISALAERDFRTASELARVTQELDQLNVRSYLALDQILTRPTLVWIIDWLYNFNARYVPYAFGALPVKSQGDVIGHAVSGLIGAITVVPQDAKITNVRAPKQLLKSNRFGCLTVAQLRSVGNQPGKLSVPDFLLPPRNNRNCSDSVIVPVSDNHDLPFWTAHLETPSPNPEIKAHHIRQFTLFWQDGLNLSDHRTRDEHVDAGQNIRLVATCGVCGDSYDWGEKGVSYRSEPFHVRLRDTTGNPPESHFDLNAFEFGAEFFPLKSPEVTMPAGQPMPVLRAVKDEEVVVHVVHPGGRARQRAFATIAQDYDDLFRGFGFPRAALLAPGKAITASLTSKAVPGCYLWFDGPTQTRSGGTWGLLDVLDDPASFDDPRKSYCERVIGQTGKEE